MGGETEEYEDTNKVETYCGDKKVWTPCAEMIHAKQDLVCVSVSGLKNARKYSSQKTIKTVKRD